MPKDWLGLRKDSATTPRFVCTDADFHKDRLTEVSVSGVAMIVTPLFFVCEMRNGLIHLIEYWHKLSWLSIKLI